MSENDSTVRTENKTKQYKPDSLYMYIYIYILMAVRKVEIIFKTSLNIYLRMFDINRKL